MKMRQAAGVLAMAAITLGGATNAWATGGEREACLEAASRAQELRDDGKLLESKASFLICARAECPGAVAAFCVKQLEETERRMPSVVFRLHDASGADISDAAVTVDGSLVMDRLTGASIPMNPGTHVIRFEHQGKVVTERTIVVNSGEKDRLVDATFVEVPEVPAPVLAPNPAATAPPPAPSRRGLVISTPTLLGFGLGVAGLASTIAFASIASGRADDLRATCAPRCSHGDVDGVEAGVTAANIAFVTGAVALAFGVVWLARDNVNHAPR